MGLLYKGYQKLAYTGLEAAREKGKKLDKQMQKEMQNKKYKEDRSMVDYKALDKHWDDLLENCKSRGRG